jgi:hypothetical protein
VAFHKRLGLLAGQRNWLPCAAQWCVGLSESDLAGAACSRARRQRVRTVPGGNENIHTYTIAEPLADFNGYYCAIPRAAPMQAAGNGVRPYSVISDDRRPYEFLPND